MVDIRLPNITAQSTEGRISQLQSYMYQMVEQLNWALNTVGNSETVPSSMVIKGESSTELTPEQTQNTFNAIKSLIIKSADIVAAYEDKWEKDFNGKYFAQSDFGTFIEDTTAKISTNSKNITETFTNVQSISGTLNGISDSVKSTDAYIKRGLLETDTYGNEIYGVEIGQTLNGNFSKVARFEADQLTFYDSSGVEVAHIGSKKQGERVDCLYVTGAAQFLGSIQFGGYKADTSDGLAFTWIGG